jgi:hypothetical protein
VVNRWDASRRAFRGGGLMVTLLVLAALATPAGVVKGVRLMLDRRGDEWIVDRP